MIITRDGGSRDPDVRYGAWVSTSLETERGRHRAAVVSRGEAKYRQAHAIVPAPPNDTVDGTQG